MNETKVQIAIEERLNDIAHGTLKTPVQDYASYMKLVGEYRGLQAAIQIMKDVAKKDINL